MVVTTDYNTMTEPQQENGHNATDHENNDHLVQSSDPEHPANLIPELCRRFYNWGWVTGTGGGVSVSAEGFLLLTC